MEHATCVTTRTERRRSRRPPAPERPPSCSAVAVLKPLRRAGQDAEGDAGRERDERGEQEHAPVERRDFRDRQEHGDEPDEERERILREDQSESASGHREQQAFGQHLADEALAAGAQGGPYGELAAADHRAREQQIREIGARDQ